MADDSAILSRLVRRLHHRDHDPLRPLIDAYMLERNKAPNRLTRYVVDLKPRQRPRGLLSPSSIGGCKRQAAFRFLGVKGRKRIDPDTEAVFDDGIWRHHRWQATFVDMEMVLGPKQFKVLAIEQFVKLKDLFIAGSLDVLVRILGKIYVIDIKGINDAGFQRITREDEPIPEHVDQIFSYEVARRIPRGILFYESKNRNETQSFVVNHTEDAWEKTAKWARSVLSHLENRQLPDKHPNCVAGNFLYQKCPFSGICFGNKEPEQIRRMMYRNFPGIDRLWREGIRTVERSISGHDDRSGL